MLYQFAVPLRIRSLVCTRIDPGLRVFEAESSFPHPYSPSSARLNIRQTVELRVFPFRAQFRVLNKDIGRNMDWRSYESGRKRGREEGYQIGYAKGYKDAVNGVPMRWRRADNVLFALIATASLIIGALGFLKFMKELAQF
jgi:hypothetical protein